MFYTLILENEAGDLIDMTATANQYMTSKIVGLSPPPGTISTSSYAGMDGSYLNNAFIEKRNVVISFEMRGVGVETHRNQLYKVVKSSRYIKIYYATAGIDVFVDGYCGFLYFDDEVMPLVALHWEHSFNRMVSKYNEIYRVQMPNITPHVCRYTYCSNQAKAGMSTKTLQYLMGLSEIGVTLDVYTHL